MRQIQSTFGKSFILTNGFIRWLKRNKIIFATGSPVFIHSNNRKNIFCFIRNALFLGNFNFGFELPGKRRVKINLITYSVYSAFFTVKLPLNRIVFKNE